MSFPKELKSVASMTAEECEKVEADFQKALSGCGKRTGYFESCPYHCGEQVQTSPCSAFNSYCRKCLPVVKEAISKFESLIVPARERLNQLKKEGRRNDRINNY